MNSSEPERRRSGPSRVRGRAGRRHTAAERLRGRGSGVDREPPRRRLARPARQPRRRASGSSGPGGGTAELPRIDAKGGAGRGPGSANVGRTARRGRVGVTRIVDLTPSRVAEAAALAATAWDVRPAPGFLERRLASPYSRAVVALDRKDRVIGVMTALLLGRGRAVSDETVVSDGFRGNGVAAAMLDALLRRLRQDGVRVLEGESSWRRRRELGFFLRHGFRVVCGYFAHGHPGFPDGEAVFRTELRL